MIDEIITNKILEVINRIEESHKDNHWPAVMNQSKLCQYLGGIDPKTLKENYTTKPDFPTGDENPKKRVWHKADVDKWLSEHSVPYKEVMTKW